MFSNLIKQTFKTCVAVAFAVGAGQAVAIPEADFAFQFAGDGIFGGGNVLAVSNGNGSYTAISGWEWDSNDPFTKLNLIPDASAPTEILTSNGLWIFDDQIDLNSDPIVTNGGLMFGNANNSLQVNIFSDGPNDYIYDGLKNGSYTYGSSGLNIALFMEDPPINGNVPEPATVALLGLGLLAFAASRRKSTAKWL